MTEWQSCLFRISVQQFFPRESIFFDHIGKDEISACGSYWVIDILNFSVSGLVICLEDNVYTWKKTYLTSQYFMCRLSDMGRCCFSVRLNITFFFFLNIYLFWLCRVLVVAHGIFVVACLVAACVWDLVPWPGVEPGPPALGAQSVTHWTTREVPQYNILNRAFESVVPKQLLRKWLLVNWID